MGHTVVASLRWALLSLLLAALGGCALTGGKGKAQGGSKARGHAEAVAGQLKQSGQGRLKKQLKKQRGSQAENYPPELESAQGYMAEGLAARYGTNFHGQQTVNGEIYDMFKMTAAHGTLPLPSYARVSNLENQRTVIVRINDRNPLRDDQLIQLSSLAARQLGIAGNGSARVRVEGIDPYAFQAAPQRQDQDPLLYLQPAIFSNFHSAQVVRRELAASLGLLVKVVTRSHDQADPDYLVLVGPIATPAHMQDLLDQLADFHYDNPAIVYQPAP